MVGVHLELGQTGDEAAELDEGSDPLENAHVRPADFLPDAVRREEW
jgi:hypothetical protein